MLVSMLKCCSGMRRVKGVKQPSTRRMAGWDALSWAIDGSKSGAGRITHEEQSLQARENADIRRDARKYVIVLLGDGEGVGSEATVNKAHGGVEHTELSDKWKRGRGGAHHARGPESEDS